MTKDFLMDTFQCKTPKELGMYIFGSYVNGIRSSYKYRLTKSGYLRLFTTKKINLELLSLVEKSFSGSRFFEASVKGSLLDEQFVTTSYVLKKRGDSFSTIERETCVTLGFKKAVALLCGLDVIVGEDIELAKLENPEILLESEETLEIVKNKRIIEGNFEAMLESSQEYFKSLVK